jgi:carbon-monoxide dehydrogenase small subunit
VWRAIQDPALIAGCVPGARLLGVAADAAVGDHVRGEITAALGPIRARFTGEARVTFTAGTRSGRVSGTGRDGGSGTMLDAEAAFRVEARGEASVVHLDLRHALRGPLAQFGRPAIVEALATEMIAATTANLEARLRDGAAAPAAARPPGRLGVGWLLLRVVWRALRDRIGAGGRL